jgi:uncharacterized protein YuzE
MKISFSYDAEADILYIAFGANRPGIGLPINDSVLLRMDQQMRTLIGLSIFDYSQTSKRNRIELYGLQEMSAETKTLALRLLQRSPLNRFFTLAASGRDKLYVKPAFNDLRIETLLLAA